MTNPRLRLMFSSNIIGCASGYGVQAGSLLPRLAELPEFGGRHNIAQHAWYGLHGLTLNYNGFQIYPGFDDPYGNDVMAAHCAHFGANLFVSLIDVWVLQQPAEKVAPALFCPWLPIDHDPIPEQFLTALKGAHLPLTYAKWGHQMLTDAGVPNEYIPHGIETSIYKVLEDREEVRKFKKWLTGDEETFLCSMVAANKGFPDRKWFQGQLEVFRDFEKQVAADGKSTKLYIHTLATANHGGIPFDVLIRRLGLEGKVIFPHPYKYRLGYPPEHLAMMYNASDVLLSVSMSEGFGIPIVEAQACGTPVLATNFSAMPELVRSGYLVDVADRVLTGMMSYQALPSKSSMRDKLELVYEQWVDAGKEWPMSLRKHTERQIHDEFDWDTIVRNQWAPMIARLAQEAPPLDPRFQVAVQKRPQNDVRGFLETLRQEVNKPALEAPKRRVGPLARPQLGTVTVNYAAELPEKVDLRVHRVLSEKVVAIEADYEALSNEEAQDRPELHL